MPKPQSNKETPRFVMLLKNLIGAWTAAAVIVTGDSLALTKR